MSDDPFCKLYRGIVHSSVWSEDYATRIVWVTILALKDGDGVVDASVAGLARAANVTRPEVEHALEALMAADPDDRSGVADGRRIVTEPGRGWRVVNHDRYRERGRDPESERKDRARQAGLKSAEARRQRHGTAVPVNAPNQNRTKTEPKPNAAERPRTPPNGPEPTELNTDPDPDPDQILPADAVPDLPRARAREAPAERRRAAVSDAESRPEPEPEPETDPCGLSGVSPASLPEPSDYRETMCPLDLEQGAEKHGIPAQFAGKYRVSEDSVRAAVREFVAYWTIGGGAGKERRNWMARLRQRLLELGEQGKLATAGKPPGLELHEQTFVDPERQKRLKARARAIREKLDREQEAERLERQRQQDALAAQEAANG